MRYSDREVQGIHCNSSQELQHGVKLLDPKTIALGNYQMTDSFYVVDVVDTHVVLGVQWI